MISIPRRHLGKTGVQLSLIGMGGMTIKDEPQEKVDAFVHESIEAGVNYFDVAPTYGTAELKLGNSLKNTRGSVFLACKTIARDKPGAWKELNSSLQRLQTERIDLYQLHGLSTDKDTETALVKGGAVEALVMARNEGLVKYLGFSAHSPAAALKAMREFDFDTILYPVNFVLHFRSDFEEAVLKEAKKRGMGILALKSMAKQIWPKDADRKQHSKCWYQPIDEPELAKLALHWTLSQGVTAAVPPSDMRIYQDALKLVRGYRKLTAEEISKLQMLAADLNPIFSV